MGGTRKKREEGTLPILGLVSIEVVHLHRRGHPQSLWYRYSVRSIHILGAVIPQHPLLPPASSHLLLQLARFARLFSSGRSPLHIFLHRGVSVHANSHRARTGNVGHVRWVSSCVQWLDPGHA